MRTCDKMRCASRAAATIALRYEAREVFVDELTPEPDRNLVDLCEEHVRTLVAPVGWTVRDDRNVVVLPDAAAHQASAEPVLPEPVATGPDRTSAEMA